MYKLAITIHAVGRDKQISVKLSGTLVNISVPTSRTACSRLTKLNQYTFFNIHKMSSS